MWGMHDGMGWWMLFGSITFVLFWGGLIAFAFWFADRHGRGQFPDRSQPLDIAKSRYARGDITREEFEQIRRDLSQGGLGAST
jgi:putative membrane protein